MLIDDTKSHYESGLIGRLIRITKEGDPMNGQIGLVCGMSADDTALIHLNHYNYHPEERNFAIFQRLWGYTRNEYELLSWEEECATRKRWDEEAARKHKAEKRAKRILDESLE